MNFLDYCRWRGDLSFKIDPFNEIDYLIFSQMAYLKLDGLFGEQKKLNIRELAQHYFATHDLIDIDKDKSLSRYAPYLLKEMAATERYKDCKVYNYQSKLKQEQNVQFGAMMVDIPDGTCLVAFRGTDDSLVGWKEDLILSYDDLPSQNEAVYYLNRNCILFHKYRICGHSKGGYLALYATLHCRRDIRRNIMEIVSEDGMGLRPGSYDENVFREIEDKYKLYVPDRDVVGTIYEMARHKTIVRTKANQLFSAHSMETWLIERNHFIEAADVSYESGLTRKVVSQFLAETSVEQRKAFIDELFTQLQNEQIDSILQMREKGLGAIILTIRKFSQMSEENRKTGYKMLKTIYVNMSSDIYSALSSNNKKAIDKAYNLTDNVDQLIKEYFENRKNS